MKYTERTNRANYSRKQESIIKQNLQYIKSAIDAGTLQEQKPIINVMLSEVVEAVRTITFYYDVQYSSENYQNHFSAFIRLSHKRKFMILADLEDLQSELQRRNTHEKLCSSILNNLIQSDLYACVVQDVIDSWHNTTTHKTRYKTIYVK